MATLPRPPINPNQPIPNNPFYVPETNYLKGEYSPFIIGSGLSLDNTNGVLSATGTPFAVIAGTGISIVTVGPNNTISVADSGVTAGSYTLADITVDATGRIVSASSGSITGSSPIVVTPGPSTNISVDAATLFAAGVVQLNDTTSSTSVTEALTANQGKLLQDQINALAVSSNLTFAGTIDGSTGLLQTVTTAAAAVGFIVGDPLPVAGATNEDYFVIVSVSGTMTPTGGSPTATNQGDWFLSNGTIWQFLDVGFNETYASTTAPGLIQLGTDAEVQAGTDGTKAVVPSSLQSKISDSVSTTSSTTIASSTAVKTAYDLADAAVPDSSFLASGDLLVGTGPGTYSALAAGPADYILASDGAGSLTWVQQSEGDVTGVTGIAPITVDNTDPQNPIVSVNAASTTAPGVVQLNDTLSSTSTTEALTAAQGKVLQDELNALAITSNLTFAGTLDTATGNLVTVSVAGAAQGFTVGSPLLSPAAGNIDFFVIVTVAATSYTPPGGSPTITHVGDWFLSDGTTWQFLDVGYAPGYASTTVAGIVELSTDAETQAGTDATLAVTPASLQSKVSDSVSTTSSTTIASSTAVKTAYDLADAAIPDSTILAKGDLIGGTAAGTYSALAVGINGQILYANSACSTGLCWGNQPIVPSATPLVEGIVYGCTTSASGNVMLGLCALRQATGSNNVAVGQLAGCGITTGQWNTVIGSNACMSSALTESVVIGTFGSLTLGCQNVAIGVGPAGQACAANQSVFIGGRFTGPSGATTFPVNSSIHIGTNVGQWSAGSCNVAIGRCTLGAGGTLPIANNNNNVAIGANSMSNVTTGSNNVAVGISSGRNVCAGNCNVLLGAAAGNALCDGGFNVFIGPGVGGTLPFISDSCTLRIGFSGTCTWICGLATKAIKPGGGIIDCANSCGTAGQVLMSNGANAICWGSVTASPATPILFGTVYGCTDVGCVSLGQFANEATTVDALGIGYAALRGNTTGLCNTAVGYCALNANATGGYNVAVGPSVLKNSTEDNNVGVGSAVLSSLSSGVANTAIGTDALGSLTSGCCNIAIGFNAGVTVTGGNNNLLIGNNATPSSLTGSNQLVIAKDATNNWLTGDSTLAIKPGAGIIDCAGSCGTAGQVLMSNGANAICWGNEPATSSATPLAEGIVYGCTVTTIGCSVAYGYCAGALGTANVTIGSSAGRVLESGSSANILIGCLAGCAITTGSANVIIGSGNGTNITTGCRNIGIGNFAVLGSITTGCGNIALGWNSGRQSALVNDAITIGRSAGGLGNGCLTETIAIGTGTLSFVSGPCNVAIGHNVMSGNTNCINAVSGNTAIGHNAMSVPTTATDNVAVGRRSGAQVSTGNCNILLGFGAGCFITSGSCNVVIGPNVQASSSTGSCQLEIGIAGARWLQGDSTFAIKPGAGIIDCANSCGTAGQALFSTGANRVCWGSLPTASETALGIVELATNAETQAGTDTSRAITPAALQSKLSDSISTTSSTTIASSTAVKCAYDLADAALPKAGGTMTGDIVFSGVGRGIEFDDTSFVEAISDSTITTCSTIAASATAVKLTMDVAEAAIPCSSFTAKGDLLVATGIDGVHTALPVGVNGSILVADSVCGTGMKWSTLPPATPTSSGTLFGCVGPEQIQTTAIGQCALLNYACNPGGMFGVTAIGFCALAQACCLCNTVAIGTLAAQTGNGSALCGFNGVFIGTCAGQCGIVASANNVAIGFAAMRCGIAGGGNSNIAIGTQTLGLTTCVGQNNIAIGAQAGQCISGSCNVVIGSGAAGSTLTTGSNNIVLGGSASTSSATVSNTITLGNSSITTIRAQVTTITSLSDERDKTDIVALPVGLDFINSLKPVKFTWQMREANEVKDGTSEAGFIAQHLQEAQDAAGADYLDLVYDDNPEKLEASPGKLIPVLVKAIQELSAEVEKLKAQLNP